MIGPLTSSFAGTALLAWVAVWVVLGARYTAASEGEARIARLGRLLPAFAATTCLGIFIASPVRGSLLGSYVLWLHHASFGLLLVFLLTAEYLQVEAWWRLRGASTGAVAIAYRRLWTLTEVMPAPVAVVILLTGLRLIWESPETSSLSQLWLFGLVAGFSLFFWDGIVGYRRIVRLLWEWAERCAATGPEARLRTPPRSWSLQLFAHLASWLPLFALGTYRWHVPNAMSAAVADLEGRLSFLPSGWPQVSIALAVWLLVGALLQAWRFAFHGRVPARNAVHL